MLAYFERTRTPLTSFIHSFRFSMMFFSSAMLKPVSFCSWSTYVNAGLPLFLAPCFGSQSSKSLITSSRSVLRQKIISILPTAPPRAKLTLARTRALNRPFRAHSSPFPLQGAEKKSENEVCEDNFIQMTARGNLFIYFYSILFIIIFFSSFLSFHN